MLEFCKITCLVRDEVKPPFFIGSKIRGSFGWALKAVDGALFEDFFATQNGTHPYRFDFALGAKSFDFSLYLFGKAAANAPVVCIALHKMLAQTGLKIHAQSVVFRDFALFLDGGLVFESKNSKNGEKFTRGGLKSGENGEFVGENSQGVNFSGDFKGVNSANGGNFDFNAFGDFGATLNLEDLKREFEAKNSPQNAILRLLTPLRIKKNNAFVRRANELEFNDILGSIFRRYNELLGRERVKAPHFEGELTRANAHFTELVRKSSRQNALMSLGGLLGDFQLRGLNAQSYAFLRLGELIGVGKSCVFGLGKIKLEVI